jgi:putative transposase
MPRNSGVPILSEQQATILHAIVARRDSPQHLVRRVQIVLLAANHQHDIHIAPQVALCEKTVRTWRHRWNAQQDHLQAIESKGDEKALKDFIVDVVLADDPYNGIRDKYTPEQIMQLYAIACEHPEDSDRPISHWSCRELADEMAKRGIVEHIPISTVWDFLKSSRLEATQSGRLDESKVRRSGVSRT